MGTAARMNVEITGTVDGLSTAMERANDTVTRAASQMRTQTSAIGDAFEGMAHRFEHSGVMIAFAVNNMMDGTQTGVERALHSIALLGFAFGPVVGSVTTATALILENIKKMVQEASKQLDEFKKKLDDFVNAGNVAALMKKREELLTGTPAKEGKIVPPSELVPGAFKGSLEDLEAQAAKVKAEFDKWGMGGILKVTPELAAARTQLEAIDAALAAASNQRARLMQGGDLPKVTISTKSDKREAEDIAKANKEKLSLQLEFDKLANQGDEEFQKMKKKLLDASVKDSADAAQKRMETNDKTNQQQAELDAAAAKLMATNRAAGAKDIQKAMDDSARASAESWMKAMETVQSSIEHAFEQMKEHGGSFGTFMRKIGQDMLGDFVRAELKMVEAHIAANVIKQSSDEQGAAKSKVIVLSEALSSISASAAKAAAAAWSAFASIPYIGPELGAVAAGVTYAGVMAFGALASAAGGFDVPAGLNPVTQLHAQEMVLPAHLANAVRGMAAGGGSGGGEQHFHFHTNDSVSTAEWARRNTRAIGTAAVEHVRRGGGSTSASAGRRSP
jgi:hypothetical protein